VIRCPHAAAELGASRQPPEAGPSARPCDSRRGQLGREHGHGGGDDVDSWVASEVWDQQLLPLAFGSAVEHGPGKRAGSEPERGVGAGRAAWSPMDAAKAASNQLRIALACGRARAEAFCTARGTCGLPGARRVAGGAC